MITLNQWYRKTLPLPRLDQTLSNSGISLLYRSSCRSRSPATYGASQLSTKPLKNLKDVVKLGREVRERGFTALKTNLLVLDQGAPFIHMPGFYRGGAGAPALNADPKLIRSIRKTLEALRGSGLLSAAGVGGAGDGVATRLWRRS